MFSLTEFCFLCLNNYEDLESTLVEDKDGLILEEKIYNVLSNKVQLKANIPKYVCIHCLKKLNKIYKFKKRCLQNIDVLNSYLELLTTKDEIYTKISIDLSKKTVEETKIIEEWNKTKDQTTETSRIIIKSEIEDVDIEETEITCFLFKEENEDVKTEVLLFDEPLENSTNKEKTPDEYENNKLPPREENIGLNHNNDIDNNASGSGVDSNVDNDNSDKTYVKNKEHTKLPPKEKNISSNNILEDIEENSENNDSDSDESYDISNDENYSDSNSEYSDIEYKNIRNSRISHTNSNKRKRIRNNRIETSESEYSDSSDRSSYTNSKKRKSTRISQTERTKKMKQCVCEECGRKFYNESLLKMHFTLHKKLKKTTENISAGKYKCQICPKTFLEESVLQLHSSEHNQNFTENIAKYKCHICSETFSDEMSLESHSNNHNKQEIPDNYECLVCFKKFNDELLLVSHLPEHINRQLENLDKQDDNSTETEENSCQICSKIFRQKSLLLLHLREHVFEQTQKIIDKKNAQKRKMENSTEAPLEKCSKLEYECKECGKKYSNKLLLVMHNARHKKLNQVENDSSQTNQTHFEKSLLYSHNNKISSEVITDIALINNQQNNETVLEETAANKNDYPADPICIQKPLLYSHLNNEIRSEVSADISVIHNQQNNITISEQIAVNNNDCQTDKMCFEEPLLHSQPIGYNHEIRSEVISDISVIHNQQNNKTNSEQVVVYNNDCQLDRKYFEEPLLRSQPNGFNYKIRSEVSSDIAVIHNQQNNATNSEKMAFSNNYCQANKKCFVAPLLHSQPNEYNHEIRPEVCSNIVVIYNQQNDETNSEKMAFSNNDCQVNKKCFEVPLLHSQPKEYNREIRSETSANITAIHNPQNIATISQKDSNNDNDCQAGQICLQNPLPHSYLSKNNNEISANIATKHNPQNIATNFQKEANNDNDCQAGQIRLQKPLPQHSYLSRYNNEIRSETSANIATIHNPENIATNSQKEANNDSDCQADQISLQKPLPHSYLSKHNNEIRSEISANIATIHNPQNIATISQKESNNDSNCQADQICLQNSLLYSYLNKHKNESRSKTSANIATIHNPQNILTNSEKEVDNTNKENSYCQSEKYKCQICFETFSDELLLHSHQNKHNNEIRSETSDSKEYKCLICLKIFFEESLHKLHLNTHCNKEKNTKMSVEKQNSTSINQIQQIIKKNQDRISQDNNIPKKLENEKITKKTIKKQIKNFKCKFCDKSYPDLWSLWEHNRIHKENLKINRRIPYDQKAIELIEELNVPKNSSKQTNACSKKINTDNNLEINNEDNSLEFANNDYYPRTSDRRLKCNVCKRGFFLGHNLKAHISEHKDAIQCEECKLILLNEDRLISHKRKHTGERPFRCEICHRGFRDEGTFERHKICHTEPKFTCDQCGKKFVLEDLLKKHKMYHESPKFICDLCGKGFYKRDSFNGHMSTHAGERPHKCRICPKTYPSRKSLVVHMLSHKGEKSYKCEICDKKFHYYHNLTIHKKSHFDVRPFECKHCNKKFKNKLGLQVHLRSHTGEKRYKCHICNKKIVSQESLRRHIMIHEGVKPHKCDKCDYATQNIANFRLHQNIHNGIKKHACDKCDYKTANISNLKTHKKQHEKGREYVKRGVKRSNNKSTKKSKKRIIESENEASEKSSVID